MDAQKPTVGRIVHYVSHGTPVRTDGTQAYTAQCRAAVIAELCDAPDGIDPETGTPCVSLCVLNPTGVFFSSHLPFDDTMAPGSWHWPERAPTTTESG